MIRLPRILFHSVSYNDDGDAAPAPPVFEKCSFTDVLIDGAFQNQEGRKEKCTAVELCGFDGSGHEIRDIVFRRIRLPEQTDGEQTVSLKYCRNIQFDDISVFCRNSDAELVGRNYSFYRTRNGRWETRFSR